MARIIGCLLYSAASGLLVGVVAEQGGMHEQGSEFVWFLFTMTNFFGLMAARIK